MINGVVKKTNVYEIRIGVKVLGESAAVALQIKQDQTDKCGSSKRSICAFPKSQFKIKPKITN